MNSTPRKPPISASMKMRAVLQIEAQEDQRRQGEDDARGDGLAGVAGGLDNDVLQNRSPAKGAQNADGEHRDGNRGGHRKPGAQAHIDRDGAEDDAEEGAQQNGAEGKLRRFSLAGTKG